MNIILFDPAAVRGNLLPLAFTRPIADFRVGITTIREKWESLVVGKYSYLTVDYLQEKYPMKDAGDNLFIAGNVCPHYSESFLAMVNSLQQGEALCCGDVVVAFRGSASQFASGEFAKKCQVQQQLTVINHIYDVFSFNGRQLEADFNYLTAGRKSEPLSDTNTVIGPRTDAAGHPLIFLEKGSKVEGAMLNTTHGPIYIGADAEVMEGSCIRGSFALCNHGVVNMSTRIYPETTIGPWCKVGGELNNVVFFSFSNKAHDGYLGNAVIGEWCNLGADTVSSNLRNDYGKVRVWNYQSECFERTDLQFCGLIMGDHSKAGINTMFNTATVAGIGCNVVGGGFPRAIIPSFSQGGAAGFKEVPLTKFFDTASRMMARRGRSLTEADRHIYEYLHKNLCGK